MASTTFMFFNSENTNESLSSSKSHLSGSCRLLCKLQFIFVSKVSAEFSSTVYQRITFPCTRLVNVMLQFPESSIIYSKFLSYIIANSAHIHNFSLLNSLRVLILVPLYHNMVYWSEWCYCSYCGHTFYRPDNVAHYSKCKYLLTQAHQEQILRLTCFPRDATTYHIDKTS